MPFDKETIERNEQRLRNSLASIDLEMSDHTINQTNSEVESMIQRLATGETTHEEEEERLLAEFSMTRG